jgi:DNA polymerase-3 subunit delta
MLGARRVVIVLRAEKILKPKRRGKSDEPGDDGDEEPPSDLDALEDYVLRPEPLTTLVLVATDADRQRKVYKALQKGASIVECWGLKGSRDGRLDLRDANRAAEALVKQTVSAAGQHIEPAASRLLAERAGTDITRLRADVERLLLFAAGKTVITVQDAQEVVSVETAQDDWAVTNAIGRGNARDALRQLGLALESGGKVDS